MTEENAHETVDEACDRLTPFMAEVALKLLDNEDISDHLSMEEVGEIVGEAFWLAWRKMAS